MTLKIVIYCREPCFYDVAATLKIMFDKMGIECKLIERLKPLKDYLTHVYIIFGANMLSDIVLMPLVYVVYQMEQCYSGWFDQLYIYRLKGSSYIIDYSSVNMRHILETKLNDVVCVPISYLSNIERYVTVKDFEKCDSEKMYDILFIGARNERRECILKMLKDSHPEWKVGEFFNYNLWGIERCKIVSSAKINLNLHFYENPILETTRLATLVSQGAFVISETSIDEDCDIDFSENVVFTDLENLVKKCEYYLENIDERFEFAKNAFETFKRKTFEKVFPVKLLEMLSKRLD